MAQLERWFLHVDLDAFFASVEQLDHPEYRGKPVIVGGKPEDRRSVVSTASYEARKYGVHSAMPTFQAYRLCPNGIYVHGRMERYSELSYQIMNIFRNYSPDVDQMSIDEAFIDITGTEKLFGPPLETAKKIKAEVKEKTGLTVSIGIAPTKYLAKIASGFQKPDGITFIDQGQEENFMLNLPLNKVWGLGPKSLELINSKGIKTTRDIYEMPIENLQFLFGKNMGTYLYEVVRGNEKATFSREAKNHSISSESTYPYDLTDLYAIETELLELCHGVFFRLLKENGYSRTAFVKIRYDDFSTCSIQETLDRNIITLDTYYETIKKLFEKKYEKGRGIRLLGVGFENIDTEEKPYQQDLFENKDEKKQAVEKAILTLEKKHPEIKVRKARTFRAILLLSLLAFAPSKLKAQENEKLTYDISGFYKADFTTGFSKNAFEAPVFKQEVDITASLLYNQHWYFKTAFADNFERNTFTIGYKAPLIDAKISNRNVLFPSGYSSALFGYSPMGGINEAPGISVNLTAPDNKWAADFLLRYDMTSSHSATFYGNNKVTDTFLSPANFTYGLSFNFPENTEEDISQIANIFIETENGTHIDANGKHYKQLSKSDYTILINKRQLYISNNAGGNKKDGKIPTILVTFTSNSCALNIKTKTGSYSDSTSFAGKINQLFGEDINLDKYKYETLSVIENSNALVIQNSIGFSPYLNTNLYDTGSNTESECYVVSKNSDSIIKEFNISPWDDIYNNLTEDLFFQTKGFIQISYNTEDRYPFVKTAPEIYLSLEQNNDYSIRVRKYSTVSELSIGKKAVAGTVQVYKNGLLDNSAVYDAEKGIVNLSSPVTNTDKIFILWQEEANNYNYGAVTTAAGYKINFTEKLSSDISLSAFWPLYSFFDSSNYSTIDTANRGYSALTAGLKYKDDNLYIYDAINVAVTKENVADKLLVYSHEHNVTQTTYLNETSGYNTNTAPSLNTPEGSTRSLKDIDNFTTGTHKGIKSSQFKGYILPLSWTFSNTQTSVPWAAVDIKLASGTISKNLSTFDIYLKPDIPQEDFDNYDFYIQLGIKASEVFTGEDKTLIPTWKLPLQQDSDFQLITISLSDSDRTKLTANSDARIIVVPKAGKETIEASGSIYTGPYKANNKPMYLTHTEDYSVISSPIVYGSGNYGTFIKWNYAGGASNETPIEAKTFFTSTSFSNYKKVSFDFAAENTKSFKFLLRNYKHTALEFTLLDLTTYGTGENLYHHIEINLEDNTVYLDNIRLSPAEYTLAINKTVAPSTQIFEINSDTDGSFTCGNLFYNETDIIADAKNYTLVEYNKRFGTIDLKATAVSTQATGSFTDPQFYINSNGKVEASGTYVYGKTDIALDQQYITNAGHLLKTNKPLFNVITATEDYRFNKAEKSLLKANNLTLDFNGINIPVKLNFTTSAQDFNYNQNQKIGLDTLTEIKKDGYSLGFSLKGNGSQFINTTAAPQEGFDKENYFVGWKDISALAFSHGNSNANERIVDLGTKLYGSIPFGKLSPALTYSLNGRFQNNSITSYTDKESLQLSVPFSLASNHNLTINISRNGSGITEAETPFTAEYFSDTEKLFNLQSQRTWFYTAIPIYELFSANLKDTVTANYSAKYEALYSRKLFNSYYDLFIPSAVSISVIRDIKANDISKDVYQYKAVISNTSLNNFGAQSKNQTFKWFKQEEILSNITGIVKVPVDSPENTTYQLSAFLQTLFYISDVSNLTITLNGTFETNENFNLSSSSVYTRASSISPIKSLAQLIVPYLKNIDFGITRKDSLTIQIGNTNNTNKQTYTYLHNVDHKILEHYSFTIGLSTSITNIENESTYMDFFINLGFKAEF